MNPAQSQTAMAIPRSGELVPPAICDALRDFLRECGSPLSAPEAVSRAIRLWIDTERANAMPARGYQWKQLFLPAGTRVRLHCNDTSYIAQVEEDELMYRGHAVSPHQMVRQVL